MFSRWHAVFAALLAWPALASAAALDQWTYRTNLTPAATAFTSVSHGAGRFVAAGRFFPLSYLYSSVDGVSWTYSIVLSGAYSAKVRYLHDRFVVVDDLRNCLTSTNGLDWVNVTPTNFAGRGVSSFAYGHGTWVFPGTISGCIWSTTNFVDWTEWKATNGVLFRDITFGQGRFVVVDESSAPQTSYRLLISTNGRDWNNYSNAPMSSVTYGQGMFVGVSRAQADHFAMTSYDGLNWARRPMNIPHHYVSSLTYGNGTFIAVGSSNQSHHTVVLSTDGTNWTPKLIGPRVSNNFLYDAAHGASSFVVVGEGHRVVAQSGNVAIPQLHQLQPGPSASLDIDGEVGRAYRLESSTDLLDWETVRAYTNDAPRTRVTIPPTNAVPARFYRAVIP